MKGSQGYDTVIRTKYKYEVDSVDVRERIVEFGRTLDFHLLTAIEDDLGHLSCSSPGISTIT